MQTFNMADGSLITAAVDGRDSEGRVRYVFDVRAPDGRRLALIYDIRSGVNAVPSLFDGMAAFASFLGAWVESFDYPDSENADMFPESLRDWADVNADELSAEFGDWN